MTPLTMLIISVACTVVSVREGWALTAAVSAAGTVLNVLVCIAEMK